MGLWLGIEDTTWVIGDLVEYLKGRGRKGEEERKGKLGKNNKSLFYISYVAESDVNNDLSNLLLLNFFFSSSFASKIGKI